MFVGSPLGCRQTGSSGLRFTAGVHCPCLWVESLVVFHVLPGLAFLPPLSGWASVCFEDRKHTQHSLGGGRKATEKGGEPKAGVNTGGQRE